MGKDLYECFVGDDDFIVSRHAKERFAALSLDVSDEFSREIVEGTALRVDDVADIVSRFRSAVQTVSLFGDRKVVWLKGVNFVADSVVGRSENTKTQLALLQEVLQGIDPEAVQVLISASPVDRRRREFKWLMGHGKSQDWKGSGNMESLAPLLQEEAEALKVRFAPGAVEVLTGKVNGNSRLAVEEVRKLATWLGDESDLITEQLINELVPNFGEGDFFEPVEAFFALDLEWTLDALERYFFNNTEARPLLTVLQGRIRLLIQVQALIDGGRLKLGPRGFSAQDLQRAGADLLPLYGELAEVKSGFNLFSQNAWYVANKVAPPAKKMGLRQMLAWQEDFFDTFSQLLTRFQNQESVMRELAIRCLGAF